MSGFGVFEHFERHPQDVPYKECPRCGGALRMFKYAKREGEIVFYCPACDWNHTVSDLRSALGEAQASNAEKVYLDGDVLVTIRPDGFSLAANAARL